MMQISDWGKIDPGKVVIISTSKTYPLRNPKLFSRTTYCSFIHLNSLPLIVANALEKLSPVASVYNKNSIHGMSHATGKPDIFLANRIWQPHLPEIQAQGMLGQWNMEVAACYKGQQGRYRAALRNGKFCSFEGRLCLIAVSSPWARVWPLLP